MNLRPLAPHASALAGLRHAPEWSGWFSVAGFFMDIAGSVTVKLVGIMPVAAALLLLLKSPSKAYLKPGDLSRQADVIV